MSDEEREELIEKMANAMFRSKEYNGCFKIMDMARAALAVAEPVIREQCAEIAESLGNDVSASKYESSFSGKCVISASLDIADAIREGVMREIIEELRARIAELEAALKEVHRRTGLLMTQNQGRWNMSLEHDRRTADVLSVNQDITSAALGENK